MFFSLYEDVYVRQYGKTGLIVRKPSFSEKAVDEIGYIFLSQLRYRPRHIDEIVKSLTLNFEDINEEKLKIDVIEFYNQFVELQLIKCESAYSEKYAMNCEMDKLFSTEYSLNDLDKEFFLDTVHIELTKKCNERCVHCYIPHNEKNLEFDCNFMMDILEQCRNMGVITILLSGGEPLLHPNFCDILKRAKDLDLYVEVFTNLTVLSDDIIKWLKYRHTTMVNVSVYSMNPVIHDKITTVDGSLEKTKNNILKLKENGIPVGINCMILQQNIKDFGEVIKWGKEHNCLVTVDYQIIARTDKSIDNLDNRVKTSEIDCVLQDLLKNSEYLTENQKILLFQDKEIDFEKNVCCAGVNSISIETDGKVYPCVGWHYLCGNLKKQSLREVWDDSEEFKKLRKIHKGDFVKCKDCKDNKYCQMCMARNYNENGDIFNIPQITCDAAEIHHKVVEEYRKKLIVDSK